MSGCAYVNWCPVCGVDTLNIYNDNDSKLFEIVNTNCSNCWFYSTTKIGRIDLEEYLINQENEAIEKWEDFDKEYYIKLYNSFSKDDFDIY